MHVYFNKKMQIHNKSTVKNKQQFKTDNFSNVINVPKNITHEANF